jgi:hypothetical protein
MSVIEVYGLRRPRRLDSSRLAIAVPPYHAGLLETVDDANLRLPSTSIGNFA